MATKEEKAQDKKNIEKFDAQEAKEAESQAKVKSKEEKDREKKMQEAILSSQNSEKSNEDTLRMNAKELKEHIFNMRQEIVNLSNELETKQKAINHINEEILHSNSSLARAKDKFESDNKSQMLSLEKKLKEANDACEEYKILIKKTQETRISAENDKNAVATERKEHLNYKTMMEKNHSDILAEATHRENDVLAREAELKQEKEDFEKYKSELEPQLKKIQEIKDENNALLGELASNKEDFQHKYANYEKDKAKLAETIEAEKAKLKEQDLKLKNEIARLSKWEDDIRDNDQMLKIREKEVEKMRERFQLKKDSKKEEKE
jgi:hypothetical protein